MATRSFTSVSGFAVAVLVWFVLAGASAVTAGGIPVARNARLGGSGENTRLVLELDKPVSFNVFTLANPNRIIVDMPEVNFQMPAGTGVRGYGLVKAFRYGLFSAGKSRMVIDVAGPVKVAKSFILPAGDGKPVRLVLDLALTSQKAFEDHTASVAARRKAARLRAKRAAAASLRGSNVPLPRAKPLRLATRPERGKSKPVIVVDPGHGGVDPGASGRRGSREKHLVLAFAKTLAAQLKRTGRYKVYLTRSRDVFIRLGERVRIATRKNADLFISIHADSIKKGSIRGATIYTLSEKSSDKEAAALAAKENRADIIAGVDLEDAPDELAGIFIDLAQREAKNESIKFAKTAVSFMRRRVLLNRNPHRYAGFRVLKSPNFPSVLIELGYLSSYKDEAMLNSQRWRSRSASAIVQSVNRYFSKRLANR